MVQPQWMICCSALVFQAMGWISLLSSHALAGDKLGHWTQWWVGLSLFGLCVSQLASAAVGCTSALTTGLTIALLTLAYVSTGSPHTGPDAHALMNPTPPTT